MGVTELIVIVFLAVLGFLAYGNSKKVARELRRMGANK
jgi:cytochrome c1